MGNTESIERVKEKKIYTMSKPPTPEDPYLHPARHSRIIRQFRRERNATHTLNSGGEVDFYLLLDIEDDIEELTDSSEEFGLDIRSREWVDLEIYYRDEILGTFHFDFDNPMDCQSLKYLLDKKHVNIYYINTDGDEYICSGFKTVYLPRMLCYDIRRHLEGRKPLLLPTFGEDYVSDEYITTDVLMRDAWGFYLDFTALLNRIGRLEEAEEIVTRHILHGVARLQRARRQNIKNDRLMLWVGRRVTINRADGPGEYYSIYLSGELFCGNKSKDTAAKIIEEILAELPEFEKSTWVSPLAEEAIPLVVLVNSHLYRINLTNRFYSLSDNIFKQKYLPHEEYKSYYQRVLASNKANRKGTKVYDFFEKRRKKYYESGQKMSSQDLLNLIRRGNEKDLPWIFENLERIKARDMDEILVSLCEKYKKKIEPFLLPFLNSTRHPLKAVAILGLGMIESVKAIPPLVDNVKGARREASLAKYALALIGEPALPLLMPLLTDKKAEIRVRGIETLALLGTPSAISAIRDMKKDRSIKVEQAKIRAMQKNTEH